MLEFKYLKEKCKDVQAIQQIKDKKYDEGLTGQVAYIGLAHYKKKLL